MTDKLDLLHAKITEARELLNDLEKESQRLNENKMHQEIENLEVYMEETELHFSNFTLFKKEVMSEIRDFVNKLKSE